MRSFCKKQVPSFQYLITWKQAYNSEATSSYFFNVFLKYKIYRGRLDISF